MNRYLAIAYVLTVAIIAASMAVARDMIPQLAGETALVVSQAILMALLPAAILAYKGSKRSIGKLRRTLGYSLFAANLVFALSGCMMALLLVTGVGRVAAA